MLPLVLSLALLVPVQVDYVVDGDTIRLEGGAYVRLIGIDTPETGDCGSAAAEAQLTRMIDRDGGVVSLPNPVSVDNEDRYGRMLRYVQVGDRDTGAVLLRKGLAVARYDSRDGYDWHPREDRYHRLDEEHPDTC
jgi:endonuclease YncB( thermonuclease family)